MKNGLENFKYEGCGHYKLREVCKYIVSYVISSYKLKFKLLNNISHAISAANEDQCKTSQWGRCHAFLIWAFCLVTSVSHCFIASVATVTDCDLPHLSSAIWCIQWFLVHWGISSIQNFCNWILVECLNTLSKKKGFFLTFSAKITQIYIQFFGEWEPICKYQEIETCYTLETWDYYRDYICAHNTKRIKEIAPELTPEKCFDSLTSVMQWPVNDCSAC